MPIYVVTGKLGTGKTLLAVSKIREYVRAGRRVATNLDLRLDEMLPSQERRADVVRVPDKPTVADLEAIGMGCDTVDESRYGLLVLDELGAWLNSRQWADQSRQGVVDWLIHSRKKRWDIFFLVQHSNMLDKQVREALLEYRVVCKRLDRIRIPVLGRVGQLLTFGEWDGRMPRSHLAVVIHEASSTPQNPLVVDRWFYRGTDLYRAYDTEQVFSSSYDAGVFSYLTPWHVKGRYEKPALPWWVRVRELVSPAPRSRAHLRPNGNLRPLMGLAPEIRWRAARSLVERGLL